LNHVENPKGWRAKQKARNRPRYASDTIAIKAIKTPAPGLSDVKNDLPDTTGTRKVIASLRGAKNSLEV
jgi:hypothetical protein